MAARNPVPRIAGLLAAVILLGAAVQGRWASAQESSPTQGGAPTSPTRQEREPAKDPYQRSVEIYEFRKAAESGRERGREIFYYKCWFCHNEFVKGAPDLRGLYSRSQLTSGQPVNDETVREKIRNGGPGMPAYQHTLRDADITDLVTFLREGCCWNNESPPANPRYRARE